MNSNLKKKIFYIYIHGGGLVTKSRPTLVTPCSVTCQAPLSMGLSRQEWVAISFSSRSSQPRIKPRSPALQADSLLTEPPGKPIYFYIYICTFGFTCWLEKWLAPCSCACTLHSPRPPLTPQLAAAVKALHLSCGCDFNTPSWLYFASSP